MHALRARCSQRRCNVIRLIINSRMNKKRTRTAVAQEGHEASEAPATSTSNLCRSEADPREREHARRTIREKKDEKDEKNDTCTFFFFTTNNVIKSIRSTAVGLMITLLLPTPLLSVQQICSSPPSSTRCVFRPH